MAYRLAVELPDTFAAIAAVSSGFTGAKANGDESFAARTPVSVLSILGSGDRAFAALSGGLANWYGKESCTAGAPTFVDTAQAISRVVAPCADGTEVVSYTIAKMGHSWPGGKGGLGDPTIGLNATDTIWQFFAAHPRRTA